MKKFIFISGGADELNEKVNKKIEEFKDWELIETIFHPFHAKYADEKMNGMFVIELEKKDNESKTGFVRE